MRVRARAVSCRLSAGACVDVAVAVARGEAAAGVAVVRPPGHHAESNTAMGFCFFNNAGIAARAAQVWGALLCAPSAGSAWAYCQAGGAVGSERAGSPCLPLTRERSQGRSWGGLPGAASLTPAPPVPPSLPLLERRRRARGACSS